MSDNAVTLSTFVLDSPFTDSSASVLEHVRDLGYDGIELCIEDFTSLTSGHIRDRLSETGLTASIGGAFGERQDISHDSPEVRELALDYLFRCISFAEEVGASIVSGPMYSAAGKTRMLPQEARAAQRGLAVEGLKAAADFAGERGVTLGIEPLNRFETDLVNTVSQALELCELIGRDNVGLTLDTFHLNIEEKSLTEAILSAGSRVVSFQASENDRGAPGDGHVPWDEVFDALAAIDYDGAVVVESFRPDAREIAGAVSLWRPVAASMDDLARDSIRFIRQQLRRVSASAASMNESNTDK